MQTRNFALFRTIVRLFIFVRLSSRSPTHFGSAFSQVAIAHMFETTKLGTGSIPVGTCFLLSENFRLFPNYFLSAYVCRYGLAEMKTVRLFSNVPNILVKFLMVQVILFHDFFGNGNFYLKSSGKIIFLKFFLQCLIFFAFAFNHSNSFLYRN